MCIKDLGFVQPLGKNIEERERERGVILSFLLINGNKLFAN